MLIIFESPDKTGKSTLAKMLSKELEIPYIKLKNINIKDNEEIKDGVSISTRSQLETVAQLHEKGVIKDAIFDRLHASEFVYSRVLRNSDDKETGYIRNIEDRLFQSNDVILVRPIASPSTIKDRWEDEKLIDWSLLREINNEYNNFYNQTKLDVIEVDTDVDIDLSFMYLMAELYKRGIAPGKPRERRISHVDAMMNVAKTMAKRSPDLSRKVGCVITENGYIVAASYNGPPSGMKHDVVCPRRSAGYNSGEALDLSRAVHAEQNALLQAGLRFNRKDSDLILFSTDQPCIHCMRMCIQAGIKKIYYINPYPHKLALEMAEEAGIELIQVEG